MRNALVIIGFLELCHKEDKGMIEVVLCWGFPGGPVVKTSPSKTGVWVRSLAGELRSHMPAGQKTKT